jgi:hypothetical protein
VRLQSVVIVGLPIREQLVIHRLRHLLVRLPGKVIFLLLNVTPLRSLIQETRNRKSILFCCIADHRIDWANELDLKHNPVPLCDINRLRIKAI